MNTNICRNHKQGQAEVLNRFDPVPQKCGRSTISNKCFFYIKGGCSFRRFNCNRELIPDCWRSYRKSMYANIELSLRNKYICILQCPNCDRTFRARIGLLSHIRTHRLQTSDVMVIITDGWTNKEIYICVCMYIYITYFVNHLSIKGCLHGHMA